MKTLLGFGCVSRISFLKFHRIGRERVCARVPYWPQLHLRSSEIIHLTRFTGDGNMSYVMLCAILYYPSLFCFLLLLQNDVKLTATSLLLLSTSTATMVSLCSWLIGISDSYFCFPVSLYLYLRRVVAHVFVSRKRNITVRHFPVLYSSVMQ